MTEKHRPMLGKLISKFHRAPTRGDFCQARLPRIPLLASIFLSSALAVSGPALAAISYVQSAAQTGGVHSTVQAKFPSVQLAGDLNVVFIGWLNTRQHLVSVTDTNRNVYTLVNSVALSGLATQAVYYAQNIAGAAANGNSVTVTFDGQATQPDVRISESSASKR